MLTSRIATFVARTHSYTRLPLLRAARLLHATSSVRGVQKPGSSATAASSFSAVAAAEGRHHDLCPRTHSCLCFADGHFYPPGDSDHPSGGGGGGGGASGKLSKSARGLRTSTPNPPEPPEVSDPAQSFEYGWVDDAPVRAEHQASPSVSTLRADGSEQRDAAQSMLGATPPPADLDIEAGREPQVHGVSASSTPLGHEPDGSFPPFDAPYPRRCPRTRLERSYDEALPAEEVLEEAALADSPRQRRLMEEEVEEELMEQESSKAAAEAEAEGRPRDDGYVANVDEKESSHQRMSGAEALVSDLHSTLSDAAAAAHETLAAALQSTKQEVQQLAAEMKHLLQLDKQTHKDEQGGKIAKPEDEPATML